MTRSAPPPSERIGAPRRRCVYCLANEEIREDQILLRGEHLYLCAPQGQLIEGFLAISPYPCIGSLSQLPAECFDELARMKMVVAAFYRQVYGFARPTMYEQGRGGRGALTDPIGGFPFHAHLCCFPASVDLHRILGCKYVPLALRGPEELPLVTRSRPYVYVEATDCAGAFRTAVYMAASNEDDGKLEQERLRFAVAAALNLPERGDWRACTGNQELTRVVERFAEFRNTTLSKGETNVRAVGSRE